MFPCAEQSLRVAQSSSNSSALEDAFMDFRAQYHYEIHLYISKVFSLRYIYDVGLFLPFRSRGGLFVSAKRSVSLLEYRCVTNPAVVLYDLL